MLSNSTIPDNPRVFMEAREAAGQGKSQWNNPYTWGSPEWKTWRHWFTYFAYVRKGELKRRQLGDYSAWPPK